MKSSTKEHAMWCRGNAGLYLNSSMETVVFFDYQLWKSPRQHMSGVELSLGLHDSLIVRETFSQFSEPDAILTSLPGLRPNAPPQPSLLVKKGLRQLSKSEYQREPRQYNL